MEKSFLFLNKVADILKNDYNVTINELKEYAYCGGDSGAHLNYYKKTVNKTIPKKKSYCICGHHIEKNCYIRKDDKIIILGRCCIKKFIPKDQQGRHCEKCKKPHKNRKVNRCNDCRLGFCDDCDAVCPQVFKKCYDCFMKK